MKFMKSKKIILEKCTKIKLILTDVDGVLTDGGRYFSENSWKRSDRRRWSYENAFK